MVSLTVQGKSRKNLFFSIVSFVVLHEERTFRSWYYQLWSTSSDSGGSQSTSQFKNPMQIRLKFLQLWSLGTEDVQNQIVKLISFQDRKSRRNKNPTESFECQGILKEKIWRSSIMHRWLRKKKIKILAQDMWVRDYLLLLLPENYSTSVTV